MGLLDLLFGRAKAPRMDDAVLGALRFHNARWHGEVVLKKPSTTLSLTLEGDEDGPTPKSKAEVGKLRKRWPKLMRKTVPELVWEFDDSWREEEMEPRDFTRETVLEAYKLNRVSITVRDGSTEVEIDFELPEANPHTLTLHLVDWKPAGYHMDG